MALFPLSLEAIIKRQRFIKPKALSFSQLSLWAGRGQGGRGAPLWPWHGGCHLGAGLHPQDRSPRLGGRFRGCSAAATRPCRDFSGASVSGVSRLSRGWVSWSVCMSPTCSSGPSPGPQPASETTTWDISLCPHPWLPQQVPIFCSGPIHQQSEDTSQEGSASQRPVS